MEFFRDMGGKSKSNRNNCQNMLQNIGNSSKKTYNIINNNIIWKLYYGE